MGYSLREMKSNFERLRTKDVTEWKRKNIGETLFNEKRKLFKKVV
jgi:hypothetical protein